MLRFAEQLRTAEDRLWIWRMHLQVPTFAVVGMIGVFYRRGVSTSLSQVGDERQLDFIDAFEQIFAELADDPDGCQVPAQGGPQLLLHHQPPPGAGGTG